MHLLTKIRPITQKEKNKNPEVGVAEHSRTQSHFSSGQILKNRAKIIPAGLFWIHQILNCHFRLLRSPPSQNTLILPPRAANYRSATMCHASSYLTLIPISICFLLRGGLSSICSTCAASGNRSVRVSLLSLSQSKYEISSTYQIRCFAPPQVPTKKAKIKESRLQLMEDKEDPLDTFLVRNVQLFLHRHPTNSLLHSQKVNCLSPTEGEPSASAGQPPSGAGER